MMNLAPSLEQYEKLLPVTELLYKHTSSLALQILLPAFLVSVAAGYTQDLGLSGAVIGRLKRLVVTAILLLLFPEITTVLQTLGRELAGTIDDLTGIDFLIKSASDGAARFSVSVQSLLSLGNDLLVSLLVGLSYAILCVARFFTLAYYHFYWMLLVVLGPLLILTNLFEGSAGVTKTLFKNILQVSCWPIVWSIFSAFLKALPFADAYKTEGGYTTVVVMNVVIAVALFRSSTLVNQITEGAISAVGPEVSRTAGNLLKLAKPHAALLAKGGGEKLYQFAATKMGGASHGSQNKGGGLNA